MALQDIQQRMPWLMKPIELIDIALTPQRWNCPQDRRIARIANATRLDTTGLGRVLSRILRLLSPLRSLLLARSPALRNLDWRVRQMFWALIWTSTVALVRWPRRASVPKDEEPIALISAPESYPDFRAPALVVPADVPCAEKSLLTNVFVQVVQLLEDIYPAVTTHQPEASHVPHERLRQTYTMIHRLVRKPPRWHPDLDAASAQNNLLGALAVGGPFAKLLERASPDSDRYIIDLQYFDNYAVRSGLCRLGSKIHFIARDGELAVSGVEHHNRVVAPGEPGWELAERIALAGLMTHVTVWRQGMEYHVGGLAPTSVITHNTLPANHPLRRLLAPHMAQTMLTNYSTHLTLRRSGWDVLALSFPYDTLMRYFDDGVRAFDIRRQDVRADTERRNIPDTLNYPYLPQALRYWEAIESYVRSYVEHYYQDETSLEADTAAHNWFDTLDHTIINGIRSYAPTLTRSHLVKLCTLIIYSVTVAHTENSLWNYAPFMPTTVRQDGHGQPIGEVQMTVDFQLVITSPTSLLLKDFSHLALDRDAAKIMRDFRSSLMKLQRELESEPDRYWRLLPREIEGSVSG